MTDRIRHVTVTLDQDYRDDDVKSILSAIEHIKGVASVEPHVVGPGELTARLAVKADIQRKLYDAIDSVLRAQRIRDIVAERDM